MTEKSTATEFIPAEENGIRSDEGNGKRILQLVDDSVVEIVSEEPYDDEVLNHVYICDECGHEEEAESGMAQHLKHSH